MFLKASVHCASARGVFVTRFAVGLAGRDNMQEVLLGADMSTENRPSCYECDTVIPDMQVHNIYGIFCSTTCCHKATRRGYALVPRQTKIRDLVTAAMRILHHDATECEETKWEQSQLTDAFARILEDHP